MRFLKKAGSHRERAKCASQQYRDAEALSSSSSAAAVSREVRIILGPQRAGKVGRKQGIFMSCAWTVSRA